MLSSTSHKLARTPHRAASFRPDLDPLEDRRVPTILAALDGFSFDGSVPQLLLGFDSARVPLAACPPVAPSRACRRAFFCDSL
jgi:hypothetical protein